jgi:hypothetical protein
LIDGDGHRQLSAVRLDMYGRFAVADRLNYAARSDAGHGRVGGLKAGQMRAIHQAAVGGSGVDKERVSAV